MLNLMDIQVTANARRFSKVALGTAALLAGLVVASYVPHYPAPQQAAASSPAVTYQYRSDRELVQAHQNAAVFCDHMNNGSRQALSDIVTDANGTRTATFLCGRDRARNR